MQRIYEGNPMASYTRNQMKNLTSSAGVFKRKKLARNKKEKKQGINQMMKNFAVIALAAAPAFAQW
jgi:hypothetical protein